MGKNEGDYRIKGEKYKRAFGEEGMADYEALLGLFKFRRSIRKFRKDPVPRELIENMIEAARWAPSAGNSQPWEFVVVEEKATIEKLADLYEYQVLQKKWLEGTREKEMRLLAGDSFPGLNDQNAIHKAIDKVKGKAPFRDAPCFILFLADERWHHAFPLRTRLEKGMQHIVSSLASVVFAMHLAAATLNLATQWVSDFGSPWLAGMTKDLLHIPQRYMIYDSMPVGFPAYYPKPRYVKHLKELVHYGKYDTDKNRTEEEICEYIATRIRTEMRGIKV